MYIVLCYDVEKSRTAKLRKIALKYLHPVQRSVFEGEVTLKMLGNLKREIEAQIDPEYDSAVLFSVPAPSHVTKHQIGVLEENDWQFL